MVQNKTFIEITNQDIYDEIKALHKFNEDNYAEIAKIQGRVNVNRWIATTALTGVFGVAGWIIAILSKL